MWGHTQKECRSKNCVSQGYFVVCSKGEENYKLYMIKSKITEIETAKMS
jgi:hypothetical protein